MTCSAQTRCCRASWRGGSRRCAVRARQLGRPCRAGAPTLDETTVRSAVQPLLRGQGSRRAPAASANGDTVCFRPTSVQGRGAP